MSTMSYIIMWDTCIIWCQVLLLESLVVGECSSSSQHETLAQQIKIFQFNMVEVGNFWSWCPRALRLKICYNIKMDLGRKFLGFLGYPRFSQVSHSSKVVRFQNKKTLPDVKFHADSHGANHFLLRSQVLPPWPIQVLTCTYMTIILMLTDLNIWKLYPM